MIEKIKGLFIPREENNYRARLLHPSFLALIVGVFLFSQTCLNLVAMAKPGVLGYSSTIQPEAIIGLTNKEREAQRLSRLVISPVLSEAARRKAEDMFAFDYWAHESPSGRKPWSFFKEAGYDYVVAGENLAKDFSKSDAVVAAWMKSPTHKANIVDPRFEEIGVAVVEGNLNGYQTTLVVQLFGTPSGVAAVKDNPLQVAAQEPGEKVSVASLSAGSLSAEEGGEEIASEPVANPLAVTKGISGFLFGMIAGAVIIDAFYIFKSKTKRFSGSNIAHAAFLAVIFFLILSSSQGAIN